MNFKSLALLSLLFTTAVADDGWDDDDTWGLCYFDDKCLFSCGDAQTPEDCLKYQQGPVDANGESIGFPVEGQPGVYQKIPVIDAPYFKLGQDGPCVPTEPEPELLGWCCDECGGGGTNCEKRYWMNNDGCVAEGKKFFHDRVAAYYAGSDEHDDSFCYEVDEMGRRVATPSDDDNKVGSGSGDPHFKTWTGDKFDYHGECDLVLIDNPTFMDGLGLKLHVRTTRVNYYSYIERIALQLGEEILEFANDVETFWINGKQVEPNRRYHKTKLSGFLVRRGDKKSISVRLSKENYKRGSPKIDFITRTTGFPAIVVNSEGTDIFKGSLGLLGDWSTGKRMARDGKTLLDGEDATDFALEWQVRDTEPLLFREARAPQFPTQCIPPAKIMGNRLGSSHMREQAEALCASWKEDKDECVFDVMATRDIEVAKEGAIKMA